MLKLYIAAAMADAWCYKCGGDHAPPRGRNCKKEPSPGYKPMSTRRTKQIDAAKMTVEEAEAARQEEINAGMAELQQEDKFGNRQEYLEYLEATSAAQEEQDRVEELEHQIRERISRRVKLRGKKETKDATPPPSREVSPERDPHAIPPMFKPTEGRDSSADRLTKLRKKFDLKRYTRGREPRSLLYPELMYVSINWACVGIDEGTFNSLEEMRKFLRHLAYLSFKASSDIYDKEVFAEYDADVREDCIYGDDIHVFHFGVDHLIKKHFDTEGLKKINQQVHTHSNENYSRGSSRGRGRGRGQGQSQGYTHAQAPPPVNSQGVRTTAGGELMTCNRFNGGGCDSKTCAFAHVCRKCYDPTHKGTDCTNVRMYMG